MAHDIKAELGCPVGHPLPPSSEPRLLPAQDLGQGWASPAAQRIRAHPQVIFEQEGARSLCQEKDADW